MKRYIKVILGVIAVGIAVYIYSGFWGNPIEYLQAKKGFEDYSNKRISKTYST